MKEYTEKELVNFGNYLLHKTINSGEVGDWDIANWKESETYKTMKLQEERKEKLTQLKCSEL